MLTPLICVVIALVTQQTHFFDIVSSATPISWQQTALVWALYFTGIWALGRLFSRRVRPASQMAVTAILDVSALIGYILLYPEAWWHTRAVHDFGYRVVQHMVPNEFIEIVSPPYFIAYWVGLLPFLVALILVRRREAASATTSSTIRFLGLILLPYFIGSLLLETAIWDLLAIHTIGSIPDWQYYFAAWNLDWPVTCVVIAILLTILPTLALTVIQTRPLPAGDMRQMLTNQAKETGVRYHELRLWDAGPGVVNAAVMGTLAPTRSLLITEGMLHRFSSEEIKLVFWHELGHIVQKHLLIQGSFFIAVPGLMVLVGHWIPETDNTWLPSIILLAIWVTGFTWISRTLERHADLYAMKHAGDGNLYIDVLRRLGVVTGVSPAFKSLTHGSLNQRIDFLRSILRSPQLELKFQRRISGIRRALGILICLEIAVWLIRFGTS